MITASLLQKCGVSTHQNALFACFQKDSSSSIDGLSIITILFVLNMKYLYGFLTVPRTKANCLLLLFSGCKTHTGISPNIVKLPPDEAKVRRGGFVAFSSNSIAQLGNLLYSYINVYKCT